MAIAGFAVLALVAGSAAGIAALTGDDPRLVTAVGRDAAVAPGAGVPLPPPGGDSALGAETARGTATGTAIDQATADRAIRADRAAPAEADRTATRAPRRTLPPPGRKKKHKNDDGGMAAGGGNSPAPPTPVVRIVRVSETEPIPFRTRLIRDPSLPRGSKRVRTQGVPGERVLHYEITYTGTVETGRRLIGSTVSRRPQHRVIAFGNRHRSGTHDGGGISQNSGGGGGDRQRGECRPAEPCFGLGRSAACTGDPAVPLPESTIDGDLSLLTPADLDEFDLAPPCVALPDGAASAPAG
jgi:hypothetical protein